MQTDMKRTERPPFGRTIRNRTCIRHCNQPNDNAPSTMGATPIQNPVLCQRNERRSKDMKDDFVYNDQSVIDEYTPKAQEFIEKITKLL